MTFPTLRSAYPVQAAYQIARRSNIPVYIVGGAVRDTLLGIQTRSDCDFAVKGSLERFVEEFAGQVHGKVIPWSSDQIRVVCTYQDAQLTVDFSRLKKDTVAYDLAQRDFTINAMAVDIRDLFARDDPEVIDPCNGISALRRKVIACSSSTAFDDDPLRMLRAVRLAQEFAFSIDPETFAALPLKAHLLDRISRERVKRELFMILGIRDPSRSIRQLDQAGILRRLLPELEGFRFVRQTAPHQYCLFDHLLTTVEKIDCIAADEYALLGEHGAAARHCLDESIEEGVTRKALLVFTALLHDSGKSGTGADSNGRTTFYGHENKGAQYNRSIAERLGLGRRAQSIVARITKQHMRLLHLTLLDSITERAQSRLLQDIGEVFWEVVVLAVADMMATGTDQSCQKMAEKIAMLGVRLANRRKALFSTDRLQPLLSGTDILQLLDTQPGPHIGALLSELQDAERDGRINTRDEAVQWVQRKIQQP